MIKTFSFILNIDRGQAKGHVEVTSTRGIITATVEADAKEEEGEEEDARTRSNAIWRESGIGRGRTAIATTEKKTGVKNA